MSAAVGRQSIRTDLAGRGLCLSLGPFIVRLSTRIPAVVEGISLLYPECACGDMAFADFHITLRAPAGLRRWWKPQVYLDLDGTIPFAPLPYSQSLAMFEWGLNWCIGTQAHNFLVIHSAVVERGGRAMLLPGPPGAGKSTLCASMVVAGWRLLSDELALLSLDDGMVYPVVRPVSLKNESIAIMRRRAPEAVFSAPMRDTAKGTVVLMKAPAASIAAGTEPSRPAWIVFPRYQAGADTELKPFSKAAAHLRLGEQGLNYSIHGARGFELLADHLDRCDCFTLSYSDLDGALAMMSGLAGLAA